MSSKVDRGAQSAPRGLERLPRFTFTTAEPNSREQALAPDVAYGVTSMKQLFVEVDRRFGTIKAPGKVGPRR